MPDNVKNGLHVTMKLTHHLRLSIQVTAFRRPRSPPFTIGQILKFLHACVQLLQDVFMRGLQV